MPGVNCRELEGALIEMARHGSLQAMADSALTSHLETCVACTRALDRQLRLSAAAGLLARESSYLSAPLNVERALLEKLDFRQRLQRRRVAYALAGGALAASLAVIWLLAEKPAVQTHVASKAPIAQQAAMNTEVAPEIPPTASTARHRFKKVKRPVDEEQPFIAIPYTPPLDPWERADVMHTEMPVGQLVAAGFSVGMVDPDARVQADVLVGQDGRARAIRLVSVSVPIFSTSNFVKEQ